jgi:signal transduction histidine kinase
LALVKEIVELHDGTIWVESKVGEGSTFTFSIPKTNGEITQTYFSPYTEEEAEIVE